MVCVHHDFRVEGTWVCFLESCDGFENCGFDSFVGQKCGVCPLRSVVYGFQTRNRSWLDQIHARQLWQIEACVLRVVVNEQVIWNFRVAHERDVVSRVDQFGEHTSFLWGEVECAEVKETGRNGDEEFLCANEFLAMGRGDDEFDAVICTA
jgi:hypothetical protein